MSSAEVIHRQQQDCDGLDFASLRAAAITAVQEMAGNHWTDYNLHDPGVTILEQLCFGLTELAYQMQIPVVDHLANDLGQIDFEQYSLYKPHEILPTRPVTPEDYAKVLLDQVPEIDAIVMVPAADPGHFRSGLYDIRLKLFEPLISQPLTQEQKDKVEKQVKEIYQEKRNLGEDLHTVVVEERTPCFLQGRIETTGQRPLAALYAEVLFRAGRCLSSHVHIQRYETLMAETKDLTQVFTGPLTQRGYIHSGGLAPTANSRPLDELNALISGIDGVQKVYHLELVNAQGEPIQPGQNQCCYFLQLPTTERQQQWLNIHFNPGNAPDFGGTPSTDNQPPAMLLADIRRELQKLEFEYRAFRASKADSASFYALPQGRPKPPTEYYSIQHHFPSIYGINAAGVPPGAGLERRQQAQQLKAYLYPFEQLMANLLEHIQQMHQIFSRDHAVKSSYFSQFLDNQRVPDLVPIYADRDVDIHRVAAVQGRHDSALERKSRALDTLLALYGETFTQESLLYLNVYHTERADYWVVANKLRFLHHLVTISAGRAGAANLCQPPWGDHTCGALHTRLGILLGIENLNLQRPLSECFDHHQVRLIREQQLDRRGEFIDLSEHSVQAVPQLTEAQEEKLHARRWPNQRALTLTPTMVRDGMSLDAYRLRDREGGATEVYFCPVGQSRGVLMQSCAERRQAIDYVHRFKKIITQLHIQGEGFYLIEHLLLRDREAQDDKHSNDDFLHCRLSMVFPTWTARFSHPMFRQFAEKTIAAQTPAHLLSQVYWLGPAQMRAFEACFCPWREQLHRWHHGEVSSRLLDQASRKLRTWLESHHPSSAMWM